MGWIDLVQDKDQWQVSSFMKWETLVSGYATGGFSRMAQIHGVSLGSYTSYLQ
jgi:hypothetical protein